MDDTIANLPSDENIQARVEAALGIGAPPARQAHQPGQSLHSELGVVSSSAEPGKTNLDMLMDVNLQVTVELGRTNMSVAQVVDLQKGSVIELNRIAGEAVDIFVNNHILARGEVVVVDDKFGVRITELVSQKPKKSES